MIGEKLLNRYELLAEAERGGMGVVYRAQDPVLQREVAIKMIPPLELTRDTEERFQREAQLVAQMDHPAIVPIHDFGSHEGSLFFVMPWVQGTSLHKLIQDGALILDDVLQIVVQVAEALDYSHSRGVIHRDVKPANIMVSKERSTVRARVLDFGLARSSSERRLTQSGGLIGSMTNLSPEQVDLGRSGPRSDIYALGTVMYECLTGQPPFSGPVHKVLFRIVHEPPRDLRELVDCDEELAAKVHACLAKEPSERPTTGAELAAWLNEYRGRIDEGRRHQAVQSGEGDRPVEPTQPVASPLVGRRQEWATLQARLTAALAGECQFVLIDGDAGTGKSRLLLELENLCHMRELRVLRGHFIDRDSAIPYQGLCELVQDYFRLRASPEGGDGGARSPLSADFNDLAPDLVKFFPVLSEVRELRSDEPSSPADVEMTIKMPSPQADPTRLYELLARTLARIGGGRPLVLLLENLHQGNVSLDALAYIVRRLGPTPTLIVGTCRRGEVEAGHPMVRMLRSFNDDPRFMTLNLGALDADDFRRLLEIQLGSSTIRDELVRRLYEATEGNPLFGQELVRSLLDTGSISQDESGHWALVGEAGLPTEILPATIQQAVERRVEQLDEPLRHLLSLASVLGKSMTYRDLENLVEIDGGYDGDLDDDLDELVLQGVLVEDTKAREDRLHFTSGIVRDLLYHELSRRRRRGLHRRHAEDLQKRYQGRLERVYPQLVHHFSEGDVGEKTVHYALLLARRSLDTFNAGTAVYACRTALEFVEEDEPSVVRGQLLELLAASHRAEGSTVKALREAERAVGAYERVDSPDRAARAALLAAEIAWKSRQVDSARSWADTGIRFARKSDNAPVLRRLLTLGATVANLRGAHEAARHYLGEVEKLAPVDEGQESADEVPVGGVLRTALHSPINTVDPAEVFTSEEAEVAANVFETLLSADSEGNLVPSLCERWRSLENGKIFELTLRSDVCFSDGWPLVGRDVQASFERTVKPDRTINIPAFDAVSELEVLEPTSGGGAEVLRFVLNDPLPIFPALLTDPLTAIVREVAADGGSHLLGTGPFRMAEASNERVVLERNPNYWRGTPPRLDRIILDTSLDAKGIAEALRAGELDIARDLLPSDLEVIQRDPRFRPGFVESIRKNIYFLLFNIQGPVAERAEVRGAMSGVVRVQEMVWRTLGRFAQPAVCLLPPGVMGHDPGRRAPACSRESAAALLATAGIKLPLFLRAAIHPIMSDRANELLTAIFSEWRELGIEVTNETPTMEQYLQVWTQPAKNEMDLLIGRWNADFDDPDNFTYGLFHSRVGRLRHFFSSAEADELLERGRLDNPTRRPIYYQRFEEMLREESVLLPLFHDIDYRVASPQVSRLRLTSTPPFVNYDRLGKRESAPSRTKENLSVGGDLHIALPVRLDSLDPKRANIKEHFEAKHNIFESLTQISEGARVIPWLAAFFEAPGGKTYHFRLRDKVRFHDGRRLTSRDVRYTFERLLRDPGGEFHFLLLPIRGARELRDGEAEALSGFGILSAEQFVVELEEPLAFFPALLTHPGLAVVPEGCESFVGSWKDGCVGTGPFRVVGFDPQSGVDLERNPDYWRPGIPRASRLSFHFDVPTDRHLRDFHAGRLSLTGDLAPADVENLRRQPGFAAGFQEAPRLSTIFMMLNTLRGPFASHERRRAFAASIDWGGVILEALGPDATRACGLIPPGLLGYEELPRTEVSKATGESWQGTKIRVVLHTAVRDPYASLWEGLRTAMTDLGMVIELVETSLDAMIAGLRRGQLPEDPPDLAIGRWIADYPDADSFALGLLHSRDGLMAGLSGSPELDALIEEGRRETEPSKRHGIYRQVEEILAQDGMLLPLIHEQISRFSHPSVHGLKLGMSVAEVRYDELYVQR